jgi:hypothetical protein
MPKTELDLSSIQTVDSWTTEKLEFKTRSSVAAGFSGRVEPPLVN